MSRTSTPRTPAPDVRRALLAAVALGVVAAMPAPTAAPNAPVTAPTVVVTPPESPVGDAFENEVVTVLAASIEAPAAEAAEAPAVAASAPAPDRATEAGTSRVVRAGRGETRSLALTFDAGADAGYAAAILDMLEVEHVPASFGVTGQWAEANPDLVRRMVAGGHQLINHTYDHASFTGVSTTGRALTREQRWASIDRTEAILRDVAGVGALPYFRPPYGDLDGSVLGDVGAHGYSVTAMWTVDSLGWRGLPPGVVAERTLREASPGAIVVFHVGGTSSDAVALPAILAGLRARGYTFVTLNGLLRP